MNQIIGRIKQLQIQRQCASHRDEKIRQREIRWLPQSEVTSSKS